MNYTTPAGKHQALAWILILILQDVIEEHRHPTKIKRQQSSSRLKHVKATYSDMFRKTHVQSDLEITIPIKIANAECHSACSTGSFQKVLRLTSMIELQKLGGRKRLQTSAAKKNFVIKTVKENNAEKLNDDPEGQEN